MGYYNVVYDDELQHHGILGQKWGVRRFQRADGTRTPAGKRREAEGDSDSSEGSGEGKRGRKQKELSPYQKARYKYDENGKLVKKNAKNLGL